MAVLGIEPRLARPQRDVIPLDHTTVCYSMGKIWGVSTLEGEVVEVRGFACRAGSPLKPSLSGP